MSIIARGQGLRRLASAGFAKDAELEARENQISAQIDAAQKAQEMNTLGAGAGIGAMYGMKGLGAANTASGVLAPVGQTLGGASITAPVSNTIVPAAEALGSVGLSGSAPGGVSVAKGLANAGIKTGTAATTTTASGAGSTAAATGGTTVGATSSALGSLATVAAPIAIGLGVAYLINKLFD